jgi:putative spermidine/putrescine transport system ATP-binding protein
MQIEVKRIQRMAGITCLMVTHDQEEALSMADRVAVIHQGRLEQFDTPDAVYDRPATLFVNQFVGTANTLPGHVRSAANGEGVVEVAGVQWPARLVSRGLRAGAAVSVCVRPEHLVLDASGDGLAGELALSLPQGPHVLQELRLADGTDLKVVQSRAEGGPAPVPGSAVRARLRPGQRANAYANP